MGESSPPSEPIVPIPGFDPAVNPGEWAQFMGNPSSDPTEEPPDSEEDDERHQDEMTGTEEESTKGGKEDEGDIEIDPEEPPFLPEDFFEDDFSFDNGPDAHCRANRENLERIVSASTPAHENVSNPVSRADVKVSVCSDTASSEPPSSPIASPSPWRKWVTNPHRIRSAIKVKGLGEDEE